MEDQKKKGDERGKREEESSWRRYAAGRAVERRDDVGETRNKAVPRAWPEPCSEAGRVDSEGEDGSGTAHSGHQRVPHAQGSTAN